MQYLGNNTNPIDQIFAGKKADDSKIQKGLLEGYGKDHEVTYLLSQVKTKISVEKQGNHLIWKVGENEVKLGSSLWDRFKVWYKELKYNIKMNLDFFDYKNRSDAKLKQKIKLISNAYQACLDSEEKELSERKQQLELRQKEALALREKQATKESLLTDLKRANFNYNPKILDKLFSRDSNALVSPEDWAVILERTQEFLRRFPEYQKTWEKVIEEKFDPKVEPVCIEGQYLPKSLLISQSDPLKELFNGATEASILDFGNNFSDEAKKQFFLCLQDGLKGKALIYPSDEKLAVDLYKLADCYEVKWLQKELQVHLVNSFNASNMYAAMDFREFASASLDKFEDSPHKTLYLSCVEEMACEASALSLFDESFIGKNDAHLTAKLAFNQFFKCFENLKRLKPTDEIPHDRVLNMIDRFNKALNPSLIGSDFLKIIDKLKIDILDITCQPPQIIKYLEFAHQQNDMKIYKYVLSQVSYIANRVKRLNGSIDFNALEALVPFRHYAKKFQLLDLEMASNGLLDRLRMHCQLDPNDSFSNKVDTFNLVIKHHPHAKMLLPLFSLDIVANKEITDKEIRDITSLLDSRVFSEVTFKYISDRYLEGLVQALKKGCPHLKMIDIRNEFNYMYNLTNEGLNAIFNDLKNSEVLEFRLVEPSVFINKETAGLIAEVIQSSLNLETFILECEFETKEAFKLVFNAVLESKKLNLIELTLVKGDKDEVAQLENQRPGLKIWTDPLKR